MAGNQTALGKRNLISNDAPRKFSFVQHLRIKGSQSCDIATIVDIKA